MANLTKAQAKFIRRLMIDALADDMWVYADCKRRMDAINKKCPGAFEFPYGNEPCTVGAHAGAWRCRLTDVARKLLADYQATEIVGYDGHGERGTTNGLTEPFEFHFRADSESRLRSQISRKIKWYKFTITELRPMTHAQWVSAYGWGRM